MPPRVEQREKAQIILNYHSKTYTLPGILPRTMVINVEVAITRYGINHGENKKGDPYEATIMDMDQDSVGERSYDHYDWREAVRAAVGEAFGVPFEKVKYPTDLHDEVEPQKPRYATYWPHLPPKPCPRDGCCGTMVANGDGDYHCLLCARQEIIVKGVA